MKSIVFTSLRHRFAFNITVLLTAFFVVVTMGTVAQEYFRLQKQLEQKLAGIALSKLQQISLRLSYIVESIEGFASSSLSINSLIDASGRSSYLPAAIKDLARKREIGAVVVFDYAGKPIDGQYESLPAWFSLDTIRPVISLSRRNLLFNDDSGRFVMVSPLTYYDTPQGGIAAEILLQEVAHDILQDIGDLEYRLSAGSGWTAAGGEAGDDAVGVVARLDSRNMFHPYNLKLELKERRDRAMSTVLTTLYEMLVIGLVGILFSVAVAIKVGSSMASPIVSLARRVKAGIHPCGPVGTSDELQQLADSFDTTMQKLINSRDELELRVRERTAELEQQSDELLRLNDSLLAANRELQKLDTLKDEFVSTVSHELRTPLTSIKGSLAMLASSESGVSEQDRDDLLRIALSNSNRLGSLINDLLDMQKLASDKLELFTDRVPVTALMAMALEDSAGFARKYGVTLNCNEESGRDLYVEADANRIRQVLDNLVSNAVKYSPEAGVVDICAERLEGRIRFVVRDYGEGVPAEFQGKLFQKFTQRDASDRRARDGSGLGLSICKGIIDAHGGEIGHDSPEGGGALFWFILKSADAEIDGNSPE